MRSPKVQQRSDGIRTDSRFSVGAKNGPAGYGPTVPWTVMKSAFREAERLQQEEPDRFGAIVSEAAVAEPELEGKDPLSLVTLYVYDQRVNA